MPTSSAASADPGLDRFIDALLGGRLVECCTIMRGHADVGAEFVLGSVDALKWRSCLTLLSCVPAVPPLFAELIATFYETSDEHALALLA